MSMSSPRRQSLNHHSDDLSSDAEDSVWVLPHPTPLQLDKEGIKESDCEKGAGGCDYSREAIYRGAGLFEEIR